VNLNKTVISAAIAIVMIAGGTAACDSSTPAAKSAQESGQALTETAFRQQQTAVPYPVSLLRTSLERQNLADKLVRLNKPSKIGYVYLMNFGKIVGYYVIRGKVSSNQSQMTATNTVIKDQGNYNGGNTVVQAPGDDGSYSGNESGNFFFTTENVLVSTDLNYLYSDSPLPVDAPKLNAGAPSK
jgi:hypothetical protein